MNKTIKPRDTFNIMADLYDEVRPSYPTDVIEKIVKEAQILPENVLLEIAPGTGQATIRFAERGYEIHAVELGDNLAKILTKKCREFDVTIDVSSFEEWKSNRKYNHIYCATAFHWIDYDVGYKKCHELLDDQGKLILLWHVASGTMNACVKKAYDALWSYYPNRKNKSSNSLSLQEKRKLDIIQSGYFNIDNYFEHIWTFPQSKENFIKGFKTQSSYIYLNEKKKVQLNNELTSIFDELEDIIETEFMTTVYICGKHL